jgi:post-segregation antitoxin (ccd killing protein)
MTTIQIELPDATAQAARDAGLLTSRALAQLLKDAMRKRAAQALLSGAARASKASAKPMSMDEIQSEVNAVRRARESSKRASKRTAKRA